MTRNITVITAGLSEQSTTRILADRLAGATRTALTERGEDAAVDVIELRALAIDLATTLTTGVATPTVARAREQLASTDALIAVTPVFAAGYSGLFKMFFDLLDPDALTGTPALIGATAGTPRHSLVLDHAVRPLLAYLRALVVPTGVFAATEDFGAGEAASALGSRIDRAAEELAQLVSGSGATGRSRTSGNSVATGSTAFQALLRSHMG